MVEETGSQAVAAVDDHSGLSVKGLYEVIFSPTSFFAKLKDNPRILVPYLFLGIGLLVGLYLIADLLAQLQLDAMRQQAADRGQPMPPVPIEMMRYGVIGGGTFVMLLYPLIAALVALFWGNVIMGGLTSYKKLLSVMLYGEVITIVGLFITAPMMLAKGSALVSLSLGALVTPDPTSGLYIFLSKISVWLVWEIIVVGIGFSAIYDFTRNKGMVLSVLTVGLLTVIGAALSAVGTLFG